MLPAPPLPIARAADEEHLRLLAIFHYIVAAMGAVFACFPLIHVGMGVFMLVSPESLADGAKSAPPPAAVGYVLIAVGSMFVLAGWATAVCTFISGRMIARRRRRMFSFVMAAILCMFVPVGTVLGIFTLIVLNRESVQRLYAEGPRMP